MYRELTGSTTAFRPNAQIIVLLAVMLYAATDAMVKYLAARYSVLEITFFRHMFSLIPVMLIIRREGGFLALRTSRMGLHILRAFLGVGAMLLYFISFSFLPLADVIAIGFSAPLMLIVLCRVVLSEKVSAGTSLALFIGLFGVLIILQPSTAIFQTSALLPLMAAMCLSVYMLLLKMLSHTETASSLIFYVPIAGMLVSGVALPWAGKAPTLSDLGLFAIMGVVGGIALFLRNEAYSRAPAFSLIPFEYTGVIWAALLGFFVFGDSVSSNLIIGSSILVVTNIYVVWKKEARKVGSPKPV